MKAFPIWILFEGRWKDGRKEGKKEKKTESYKYCSGVLGGKDKEIENVKNDIKKVEENFGKRL